MSSRWLARWLFGPLGWQNTRPLAARVYHNIRNRYHTADLQGYVSGKERAMSELYIFMYKIYVGFFVSCWTQTN